MRRHAKSLMEKSKQCTVTQAEDGTFLVLSPSGETYRTTEYRCTCEWSNWHPSEPCSHRLAVARFIAAWFNESLSFWDKETDARRQHRAIVSLGHRFKLLATVRRS